jgi:hypothetical protein
MPDLASRPASGQPQLLFAAILVALGTAPTQAAPALIGDYVLSSGSFSNAVTGTAALGSLSPIVSSGSTGFVTGTASDAGWFWNGATAPGTGLILSGLPLNTGTGAGAAFGSYSIGMRFQFSEVSGYRRMITFSPSEDAGMYVDAGKFNLYTPSASPISNFGGTITSGSFVDFVLTRSGAGSVTWYVNGSSTPALTAFPDTANAGAVTSGSLQFFRDNTDGSEFSPAGRVSLLRIWNGPLAAADIPMAMVPEPSALALVGLGVAAILVGARYRRRSLGR